MSVKEKIISNVVVLTVRGKLMGGNETWEVHAKVKSLINDEISKVVIDLSKVKWMNSQGLGMLMSCHTSLTNVDGALKIAGATDKVQSLFMITKMITIFDTYDTSDLAVASFSS